MHYKTPYYHHPARRKASFLPFLLLIILVLIGVLVFQIVDYFQEKQAQKLTNKAAVSIIAGRAEMKVWGYDQWTDASQASILHEGDAIRTVPGSRVVLSLLNGSVIRLSSETYLELTGLKTRDGQDEVTLQLRNGEVWLKRTENDQVRTSFTVTTDHLEVSSIGTTFNVSQDTREAVRVMDGKVGVTVKVPETEGDRMRIAETLEVVFGQEVNIGQEEITQLKNRQSTPLLALLGDSFRDGEWYKWNRAQDQGEGTSVVSVSDAVAQTTPAVPSINTQTISTAPTAQVDEIKPILTAPQIIAPQAGARRFTTGEVVIRGEVSSITSKIEVTTFIAGRPEAYILQKYKPHSTQWSYLASAQLGNFIGGDNRYNFVAIGDDGSRSDTIEVILTYDKPLQQAD